MTRQELLEQKAALIATILGKMKANDWHFVQDAASDIREIDAKIEMLNEWLEFPELREIMRTAEDGWAKRIG